MQPSMAQIPEVKTPKQKSPKPEPKKEIKKSKGDPKPKDKPRLSKDVAALLNETGSGADTKKAVAAANSAKMAYEARINAKCILTEFFLFVCYPHGYHGLPVISDTFLFDWIFLNIFSGSF